jgi:hypothetical protein
VDSTTNVTKEIIDRASDNLPLYTYGLMAALDAVKNPSNPNSHIYTNYFNNQPYHIPPVALNLMSNARLGPDRSISINNHPLPLDKLDEIDNIGGGQSAGFQIGFTLAFGYGQKFCKFCKHKLYYTIFIFIGFSVFTGCHF